MAVHLAVVLCESVSAKAIQFLKEIWLPGDSTPVTAPTTSNKTEAKFGDQELFSVTYNNAFVTALAIKHPPLRQEVPTVWQVSSALRNSSVFGLSTAENPCNFDCPQP